MKKSNTTWLSLNSRKAGATESPGAFRYDPRRPARGSDPADLRGFLHWGVYGAGTGSARKAVHMQRDPHGQRRGKGVCASRMLLEQSARVLLARMRYGPAVGVFPTTTDWRAASSLVERAPAPQPAQDGNPHRHPDGSVSFGGHFDLEASVDTLTRVGAMDPHMAAINYLARKWNKLVHNMAMSALSVPGTRQGVLNPEDDDVADLLGDFADRALGRYGVYPNHIICNRSTARRLQGASGIGKYGVTMTILPELPDVLHMMDPFDRLQHTDGGAALGHTRTETGYGLVLRGYQEFAVMNTCLTGVASAATWTIPPPGAGHAGLPDRPGSQQGRSGEPWPLRLLGAAPRVAGRCASLAREIWPHLAEHLPGAAY